MPRQTKTNEKSSGATIAKNEKEPTTRRLLRTRKAPEPPVHVPSPDIIEEDDAEISAPKKRASTTKLSKAASKTKTSPKTNKTTTAGKGRKARNIVEFNDNEQLKKSADDIEPEVEPKAKKGKGRKVKSVVEDYEKEVVAEKTEVVKKTIRKGRKAKAVEENYEEVIQNPTESEDVEPEALKKTSGKGRKPFAKDKKTETTQSSVSETVEVKKDVSSKPARKAVEDSEPEEKPKRGRKKELKPEPVTAPKPKGRGRPARTIVEEPQDDEEIVESITKPEETKPEVVQKTGRGRKAKEDKKEDKKEDRRSVKKDVKKYDKKDDVTQNSEPTEVKNKHLTKRGKKVVDEPIELVQPEPEVKSKRGKTKETKSEPEVAAKSGRGKRKTDDESKEESQAELTVPAKVGRGKRKIASVEDEKAEEARNEPEVELEVVTKVGRGKRKIASVEEEKIEEEPKEPIVNKGRSQKVTKTTSKALLNDDKDVPMIQNKGRGKRKAITLDDNLQPQSSKSETSPLTILEKPFNSDETVIHRKGQLEDNETIIINDNHGETREVLETMEMLLNETVCSIYDNNEINNKKRENSEDNNDDYSIDINNDRIKRKADESDDNEKSSFDINKKLRIENHSKILTIGNPCQIAYELGPQEKLFNGHKIRSTMPRLINYPGENGVKMIASGAFHTIFIDNDDRLKSYGCNDDGSLGRDTVTVPEDYSDDEDDYEEKAAMFPSYVECEDLKFKKVTAGDMISVALDTKGNVYVFGNIKDESNKLGLFPDTLPVMLPDENGNLQKTSNFQSTKIPTKVNIGHEKAIDIAAGSHHIIILTDIGNVYSFGEGSKGQLGRIKLENLITIKTKRELFLKPQIVTFKKLELSEKIIKIFAGQWSSYAVTNLGNLYAWGLNNYYQLGFETTSPIVLPNQPDVKYSFELLPVKVSLDFQVKQVAVGQQHLLLLDKDLNVHSCGNGIYGRLGLFKISSNSSAQDFKTPQLIERERFNGEAIQSIACGDFFSLALSVDGNVFAWGQACGAIGLDEESPDVFRPTKYKGPVIESHRITQICAGSVFAAFIGEKR